MNIVDRFKWQLLANDSKQRSTAITSREEIVNLIGRYAEIEHLYLGNEQYRLEIDLEAAVIKLYSLILGYDAQSSIKKSKKDN